MPALASENGAPEAPFLFGAEKDQLLSAFVAGKDDLFRRTLHTGLLLPLWGCVCICGVLPRLRPDANFTHPRDGHKINGPLVEGTYA